MIAYAITDPSTLNFQALTTDIERFATRADMIVYRDKASSSYAFNAKLFLEEAREYAFQKVLLHGDYKLAHKLKADGVHLTSTQFDDIEKAKELGLFVVVSTHTLEEIQLVDNTTADMITFSPIFVTPNKGEPKGIEMLEKVAYYMSKPVIALGGILTEEQIKLCEHSGAKGFASIRYFK